MAPAKYDANQFFTRFHRDAIVSMAFDPTGTHLASIDAGHQLVSDKSDSEFSAYLVVWDLSADKTTVLNHQYAFEMKFGLSRVIWLELGILVAGRDGTLTIITHDKTSHKLNVLSLLAHPSLIHCMAFNGTKRQLITAGADGLALWNTSVNGGEWKLRRRMQHVCSLATSRPTELQSFIPTGVYWLKKDQFIVAYQNHPFVIWDSKRITQLREISCQGQDPRVDAAFHGSLAAVSYAHGRIELYDVDTNFFAGAHEHNNLVNMPCLVVHNGTALIHGTEDGKVILKSIETIRSGSKSGSGTVVLPPNPHHTWPISALAATYNDRGFSIATGTRTPQNTTAMIQVWHANFPAVIQARNTFLWASIGIFVVAFICGLALYNLTTIAFLTGLSRLP